MRRFFGPPLLALTLFACSSDEGGSPFVSDAGLDVDAPEADAPFEDSETGEPDPSLGGPCLDDGQCDDGVACTADVCDREIGRCRFLADDSLCQDGLFCNGVERCDLRLGCRPGPPVTCDDGNACTIDRCIEATQICEHVLRDADGDGDPDAHCGGGDCDDDDPTVSSKHAEVCANGKDDNCDGHVDKSPCLAPAHDRCDEALAISGPGFYRLHTAGALHDYSLSCAPTGPSVRDLVALVEIPEGPARDVDIVARASVSDIALGMSQVCGEADTELGCAAGFLAVDGGMVARLRVRALGPGKYPLYLFAKADLEVGLSVSFREATSRPTNETCGSAEPIAPFVQTDVPLFDAARDLASACHASLGELVYRFTLDEPSDVRIRATSEDGMGVPIVSLRAEACALPDDEIGCRAVQPAILFERALAAGTYYVAVSATAPTEVKLVVEPSAPTEAPEDEGCEEAPELTHNETRAISFAGHRDAVKLGCSVGFVDAAYSLKLDAPSDVLLVQRISQGDTGAVQLAREACVDSAVACGIGSQSPVRASARNLPAGEYRAVVESLLGGDATLTAFVRPYTPPTLVAFADGCADAIRIPEGGGFFQGDTQNASADFPAGCDYGGGSPNGAPEQFLSLELTERKRVVLDMSGSSYATLLDVRRGPDCPGAEVPSACSVGYGPSRSFLDLILDPGAYWIQVDGYAGAAGPWFLDVRLVDP